MVLLQWVYSSKSARQTSRQGVSKFRSHDASLVSVEGGRCLTLARGWGLPGTQCIGYRVPSGSALDKGLIVVVVFFSTK